MPVKNKTAKKAQPEKDKSLEPANSADAVWSMIRKLSDKIAEGGGLLVKCENTRTVVADKKVGAFQSLVRTLLYQLIIAKKRIPIKAFNLSQSPI